MSVADTVMTHKKIQSPKVAAKKSADALDAMKLEGILKDPGTLPKKRGRPPGSTNSKSPSRKTQKTSEEDATAEQLKERIRHRKLMRQIEALASFFPEFQEDFASMNLRSQSSEDLEELIEECKNTLQTRNEVMQYPRLFGSAISKLETGAFMAAANNPHDPLLKHGVYLKGLSQAVAQNQEIQDDVKLISIDMMGMMPTNPWLRLVFNLGNLAMDVYAHNAQHTEETKEKYAGL